MRWWNQGPAADAVCQVLLRAVVERDNLGGYGKVYEQLRANDPSSEMKVVRHLRQSHQHTFKDHFTRAALIVSNYFLESTDNFTNYVRKSVFGIEGKPIIQPNHPIYLEMVAATKLGELTIFSPTHSPSSHSSVSGRRGRGSNSFRR